jgi:hypothetical protein
MVVTVEPVRAVSFEHRLELGSRLLRGDLGVTSKGPIDATNRLRDTHLDHRRTGAPVLVVLLAVVGRADRARGWDQMPSAQLALPLWFR